MFDSNKKSCMRTTCTRAMNEYWPKARASIHLTYLHTTGLNFWGKIYFPRGTRKSRCSILRYNLRNQNCVPLRWCQ